MKYIIENKRYKQKEYVRNINYRRTGIQSAIKNSCRLHHPNIINETFF